MPHASQDGPTHDASTVPPEREPPKGHLCLGNHLVRAKETPTRAKETPTLVAKQ